ncbi:MAG: hypothetical protein M3Z18_00965 [Gemmatimonadota bacterium]|nr:hypothetical protein [Gemmatimonadota bacterium]
MESERSYKYDVAFSFLAADLSVAKDLQGRLEPGLAVFMYERRKEELLGRDGMDAFSEVFRRDARLSVILYRKGWGETAWTGFEESAIKSRALETRFTSLMVVRLDRADLPTWIPSQQLYSSEATDTRAEMAAVIRARAKERGAVVRTLTAPELALKRAKEENSKEVREQRQRANTAPGEIRAELQRLYSEIIRLVEVIRAGNSEIDIRAGFHGDNCAITSARTSVSMTLYRAGNTLRDLTLRVNDWDAPSRLPTPSDPSPGGSRHAGATHYSPVVSEHDEWAWRWEPSPDPSGVFVFSMRDETYRSAELADSIVRRHVERFFRD